MTEQEAKILDRMNKSTKLNSVAIMVLSLGTLVLAIVVFFGMRL